MTLIISAIADDALIQVSDQRLTRGKKLHSADSVKGLIVQSRDACFLLSYTGLAYIGQVIDRNRTDRWLVRLLDSHHINKISLNDALELIRSQATKYIASSDTPTSFVFGGYKRGLKFDGIITNRRISSAGVVTAESSFVTRCMPSGNYSSKALDIRVAGADAAIDAANNQAKNLASAAGAKNIIVEHQRIDNIVDNAGEKVFFESRIIATAVGRPSTINDTP